MLQKIQDFYALHKTAVLIVAGVVVAFIAYKKLKK